MSNKLPGHHGSHHQPRSEAPASSDPLRRARGRPGRGDIEQGHDHDGHPGHESADHGRVRAFLTSIFSSHHHDAGATVDPALRTSAEGIRAVKLSLLVLAVTASLQLVVVAVSGSVALLADTIHNLADALTAVPLGLAFWLGRRRPTRRYTYGYGRAEDLAGIFIVAMIALSAAVAGFEALRRLLHPQAVHQVAWVIFAGVIGFVGNELVAVYRIRTGRRIGSAALVAEGYHARTDGFTSLAVVVGAIGVAAGFPLADPVVGLLITVAISFVLKDAARDVYRRLMDSVDTDLVDQVEEVLLALPGIEDVDDVRIRWIGHELRAEARVVSHCDLTLAEAHEIAEGAHHELLHRIPRLGEAVIHTSPCGHDGRDHHAALAHHFPRRTP